MGNKCPATSGTPFGLGDGNVRPVNPARRCVSPPLHLLGHSSGRHMDDRNVPVPTFARHPTRTRTQETTNQGPPHSHSHTNKTRKQHPQDSNRALRASNMSLLLLHPFRLQTIGAVSSTYDAGKSEADDTIRVHIVNFHAHWAPHGCVPLALHSTVGRDGEDSAMSTAIMSWGLCAAFDFCRVTCERARKVARKKNGFAKVFDATPRRGERRRGGGRGERGDIFKEPPYSK